MYGDAILAHNFDYLFDVRGARRYFGVDRREHLSSYAPGACYFDHFAAIGAVFERMYSSTRYKNKRAATD